MGVIYGDGGGENTLKKQIANRHHNVMMRGYLVAAN